MDSIMINDIREFQDAGDNKELSDFTTLGTEQGLEKMILNFEIQKDFPEFEGKEVVVFGNPIRTGDDLDHLQGDNPYFAKGNCGLVSTANFLNLCGISVADENMITKYAIDNDLCNHGWFISSADRGGVTTMDMQFIMKGFGIDTYVFQPFEPGGSIEDIANRLEAGYVGVIGVNAGHLWNEPAYVGDGFANHEVTLTGTIRDPETGELLGLTICDSGHDKACDVLTIEELRACYEDVPGADVIFSASPLRRDYKI